MGASGWEYFVPFQEDIHAALSELRHDVFEKREYHEPISLNVKIASLEQSLNDLENLFPDDPATRSEFEAEWRQEIEDLRSLSDKITSTIDEGIVQLIKINAEEGTHSILDMDDISSEPMFGKVAPLNEQELMEIFGTLKPTHAMVEEKSQRVMSLRRSWMGTYVGVFEGDTPSEIYFTGFSGD